MFELTPFVHNNHFLNSYDPFKAMEEFEKNFFGHQLPAFKTDIRETENAYVLDAELPGFSKEDIHAEVRNGYLTIHAERKANNEENSKKTTILEENVPMVPSQEHLLSTVSTATKFLPRIKAAYSR